MIKRKGETARRDPHAIGNNSGPPIIALTYGEVRTVDADGVALAVIQGLNEVVQEKDAKIASLESGLTS